MFSRIAQTLNFLYIAVVLFGMSKAENVGRASLGASVLVALSLLSIAALHKPHLQRLRLVALVASSLFAVLVFACTGFLLWCRLGTIPAKPVFLAAVLFMGMVPSVTALALAKYKG